MNIVKEIKSINEKLDVLLDQKQQPTKGELLHMLDLTAIVAEIQNLSTAVASAKGTISTLQTQYTAAMTELTGHANNDAQIAQLQTAIQTIRVDLETTITKANAFVMPANVVAIANTATPPEVPAMLNDLENTVLKIIPMVENAAAGVANSVQHTVATANVVAAVNAATQEVVKIQR